jgi:hypothetical protein
MQAISEIFMRVPLPADGHPHPAHGVYGISVAAELAGSAPQNLRLYEARGLLSPARSGGGTRRYSDEDIVRLRDSTSPGWPWSLPSKTATAACRPNSTPPPRPPLTAEAVGLTPPPEVARSGTWPPPSSWVTTWTGWSPMTRR